MKIAQTMICLKLINLIHLTLSGRYTFILFIIFPSLLIFQRKPTVISQIHNFILNNYVFNVSGIQLKCKLDNCIDTICCVSCCFMMN